jgi:hypothetical protein
MPELAVVHLASGSLGAAPLRRFVDSYRTHPTGIDHALVVFLNGGAEPAARGLEAELGGLSYRLLSSAELLVDLAAYRIAATTVSERYVCLLNSTSVVLDEGWLVALHEHVAGADVGLVGASGSWESHYTQTLGRTLASFASGPGLPRATQAAYRKARTVYVTRRDFPPFPNHHIRTNALVIERHLFLELTRRPLRTKYEAWKLESGHRSLTRQVLAAGLETLVVGRDGVAYPRERWPESETFRSGDQSNLLVGDRRTEEYAKAASAERAALSSAAWGGAAA